MAEEIGKAPVTQKDLEVKNELLPFHLDYRTSTSSVKICRTFYVQFYVWLWFLHLASESREETRDTQLPSMSLYKYLVIPWRTGMKKQIVAICPHTVPTLFSWNLLI